MLIDYISNVCDSLKMVSLIIGMITFLNLLMNYLNVITLKPNLYTKNML